jgi:ADP-dependent NAD(P)H-hydrate dehydratase / NAD(P)H-hydrate epimerase
VIPVLSVEQIRQAEAAADAQGFSYAAMMDQAGQAVAARALALIADRPDAKLTVLVGPGNNGGDGLVAARYITQGRQDIQVRCYLMTRRDESDPVFQAAQEAGLFMAYVKDDDGRVLRHMVASADLVIDAIFGIGARAPIRNAAAKILRGTRQALNERTTARRPGLMIDPTSGGQIARPPKQIVLAVDCPSGLDCDTGEIDALTLYADETVTFIAAKPGLFESPGMAAVGRLYIAPLDMPEGVDVLKNPSHTLLDNDTVRSMLPERHPNSNKGSYGKVLVAAGSADYSGAAGLAAHSAYRGGAGLVGIATTRQVIAALAAHILEAVWLVLPDHEGAISAQAVDLLQEAIQNYDVLLLGPGLGRAETTAAFVESLLAGLQELEQMTQPALVIDADGLNILTGLDDWPARLPSQTILTPHPGEMARLCGTDTQTILADRRRYALEKAAEWNTILVLKGAHTLVASPDGALVTSPFKEDALATAGTGDVLAGLISGMLGQGIKPFQAAQIAVYLHGLAGRLAAQQLGSARGVIAPDVASALPAAFKAVEEG